MLYHQGIISEENTLSLWLKKTYEMQNYRRPLFFLLICLSTFSCQRQIKLDKLFEQASPYEKYRQRLEKSELDQTALGQDWIEAGKVSLNDSLFVSLPYQETGYLPPEVPQALSLRYSVMEGQRININLEALTQPESLFFLDVFELAPDSSLSSLHHADSLSQLSYEAEKSGMHLLRVQPELLRGGAYSLEIGFQPSLDFPVSGKDSRAVQSFFGASRDGGRRSHKGIDIFAPRGTPVLAIADGIVSRRTNSGRGGKVVWLSSPQKRFNLYYAHLDSQAVKPGQRVQVGDTLGFVGNTGNARTTPPHLHFGIYKFGRSAVDPFPFVHALAEQAPLLAADPSQVGILGRTKAIRSNVRRSPSINSAVLDDFSQHTWLQIEGKSGSWLRVLLPDQQRGYIHESLVEALEQALKSTTPGDDFHFMEKVGRHKTLPNWINEPVEVLAYYDSLQFVRAAEGYYGWLEPKQ